VGSAVVVLMVTGLHGAPSNCRLYLTVELKDDELKDWGGMAYPITFSICWDAGWGGYTVDYPQLSPLWVREGTPSPTQRGAQ
jgi:hypothetical protein